MGKAYQTTKLQTERDARGRTRYYKDWRTYQMSDHLPMWIELGIDFGERYLNWKLQQEVKPEQTLSEIAPSE
jgi:hypothetical protein